jgi:hypothetical protein
MPFRCECASLTEGTPSKGVLLEQFDELNVVSLDKTRGNKQFELTYEEYVEKIKKEKLLYDDGNWDEGEIPQLVSDAYDRFKAKADEIGFKSDTTLVIGTNKVAFVLKGGERPKFVDICSLHEEPFVKTTSNTKLICTPRASHCPHLGHASRACTLSLVSSSPPSFGSVVVHRGCDMFKLWHFSAS